MVSAAHCEGVFRRGLYVNTTELRQDGIFATVQGEYPHPGYREESILNDFMIIRLNRDIDGIPLIPLNLDPVLSPTGGERLRVMGFGHTKFEGTISRNLMETTVEAVTHTSCERAYRYVTKTQ